MRIIKCLLAAFLVVPTVAMAGKVPLDEAENICEARTMIFAESLQSRWGDYPDTLRVQDFYRSCVHAKSGSYPRQKLVLNAHLLFDLNKLLGL